MLKQKLNPYQNPDNTFSINAANTCCEKSVPETNSWRVNHSQETEFLGDAKLTFKRSGSSVEEIINLTPYLPLSAVNLKKLIIDEFSKLGFVSTSNDDVVALADDFLTITGELIMVNLFDNFNTYNFVKL